MKEFFQDSPVVATLAVILVIGLVLFLIDAIGAKPEPFTGVVIDKHYKAESNSTGTAVVSNGSDVGVATTSSHDPEKFLVMVKLIDGDVVTAECDAKLYYSKKVGDAINCTYSKGLLSGNVYSIYGDN